MNQWSEDQMKAAIEEYKIQAQSGMKPTVRVLARKWNLPKTTLQRRVKGLVEGSEHASGRKPFIPVESERELANLLNLLSERGFLLTKNDVKSLAFEFAKLNGIQGFSEDKQKAGYYWFDGFMKRNSGLEIKKPEAISPYTKMNENELGNWFSMYKITLDTLGIEDAPSHIWKCDLSQVQDSFSSQQYVDDGVDPCFQITTEEETVSTVLAAFNACGTFSPPLVIFKGNMVRNEWLSESLENVCMRASENGRVTAEMIIEWGEMFVAQLPKDDPRPHLLILDDQTRHVFSLSFLSLMKQNNVEVICYPAQQQTNQDLFSSLKQNWCEVSRNQWNQQYEGMKLPKAHYGSVFMEAWKNTATVEIAQDGFRTMGIFPINEFAFIKQEITSCCLEDFMAPIEEAAHCSTQSGSDEPSAAERIMQTSSRNQQDEKEIRGRKGLKMNQWREDQMKAAIEEYKVQAESGIKPAVRVLARKWNLPKTTFQRRVKGLVEGSEHASGRKPFIPIESERELANLLNLLSVRGFLLTKTDVKSLAFEFAKINGIQGFSEDKQKAGYHWFDGFMKRNPGLEIKKPEAISPATKMNENELGIWFSMYKITLEALGIKDTPSHIWKCDLSEVQDSFSSEQCVDEGEAPCFQITTEEETVSTVLATFNACGTFSPPLVIFKGSMVRNEWLSESLENMCMRASENGRVTAELFIEWGEMFVAQLPKDDARPHLLILDDQSRHVFSLSFLNLMNQNNVEVVCYHALQQTNQDLFRSLKQNWCEVSRNQWNQQCEGMKLPKAHYGSVFMEAWKKTATVESAQDVFRTMGMFPINEFASIKQEITSSCQEVFMAPIEEAAHCSTQSGSDEPPDVEVTSFKDFVIMQISSGDLVPNQQDERPLKGRKGLKMNQWSEDQMKAAIEEYKVQAQSGIRPAVRVLARKWNLPKTTLQRRLKGLVEGSEHASGRKPFIPVESERELANLLTLLSERGFLLTKNNVTSLAFEFAKMNGIQGFSEDKQKAGYHWFDGFMKRNPGLEIKKLEAISPATKMNENELGNWFSMCKITLDTLGIEDTLSHIWKCDLSEVQDCFFSQQYVDNGVDPCFQITTDKETVSAVLAAFNACGTFAPPLVIFKGSMVRNEWLSEYLENMCMRASENGRVTAEMFIEWGEIFVAQLPKDDPRPHLLILDDQSRHVFSLSFLSLMKQNNVEVICYPALQQTNQDLFSSLKHNWCEVSRNQWNQQCEGMKLPKAHFGSVFMEAWKKTATMKSAQDGFRTIGMLPINETASIKQEITSSCLEGFIAPIEEAAHCSTKSGLGEPPAAQLASFKDFVIVQKSSRLVKIPRGDNIQYFQKTSEHLHYNEHLQQRRKTTSYNCSGCLVKHGLDDDPKASEAWIRCSNCKACYHESCAEDDGIYEWVS